MKLDNFELKEYDYNNLDIREAIVKLNNDKQVRKFMGYLNLYIDYINKSKNDMNKLYFAYYNDYIIGFISIYLVEDKYEISYAILPEYRNEYLASLLLQEFSEELFSQHKDLDCIYLQINQENIGSKKVAELVGYQKDSSTRYKIERGMEQIYDKSGKCL